MGGARIERFRSRKDRLRQDQGEHLRQLVLSVDGLPQKAVNEIVARIDSQTAAAEGWTFVMLSPEQNSDVVDWLVSHSSRPRLAVRLWAHLFRHLRRDTCEIVIAGSNSVRTALATNLGARPEHISHVMSELENYGAISRRRDGASMRYFMSPLIATHLGGAARDKAQAAATPIGSGQ